MTWRTWVTFAVLCVFWGIPYFFIKLALVDLSPACVAWSRITLGAVVLVPIAWQRGTLWPALQHKGAIIAFAVAELVIPFSLISLAERWISSSMAGVLIATVPLTVVLMSGRTGRRLSKRTRTPASIGRGMLRCGTKRGRGHMTVVTHENLRVLPAATASSAAHETSTARLYLRGRRALPAVGRLRTRL